MKYANKTVTGSDEIAAKTFAAGDNAAKEVSHASEKIADASKRESEKVAASSSDVAEHLSVKREDAAHAKPAKPQYGRTDKASEIPALERDGTPNRALQNANDQANEVRDSYIDFMLSGWKTASLVTSWWLQRIQGMGTQWNPTSKR